MNFVTLARGVTNQRCSIGVIPWPSHRPIRQRNPAVESVQPEHDSRAANLSKFRRILVLKKKDTVQLPFQIQRLDNLGLPGFLEEGVELVPPVERQASLREAEHLRRVLDERRARPSAVAGAVHQLVLQRPAQPQLQRREGCQKKKNKVNSDHVAGEEARARELLLHTTSNGIEQDFVGEILQMQSSCEFGLISPEEEEERKIWREFGARNSRPG